MPDERMLGSFGPLRLAGRQASLSAPGAIRVLPPFNARKHLPSRLARLRELDGRTSVMLRGQGTEFDSLREYVRGDDVLATKGDAGTYVVSSVTVIQHVPAEHPIG